MRKVNLGCGNRKLSGWVNIDAQPEVAPDIVRKLEDGLPFDCNSVDVFNARAVLEHVPHARLPFVMREIYRCLKPGGLLYMLVPHWNQHWMFSDPTHYTGWDTHMIRWFTRSPSEASGLSNATTDLGFEVANYRPMYFRGADRAAAKLGLSLEVAAQHCANILEAHVWWLRKPGAGLRWEDVEKEIRDLKVFPNGYGRDTLLDGSFVPSVKYLKDERPTEPMTPASPPLRRQNNKLLWVINVPWIGGTAYWALDAIHAMREPWMHVVMYVSGEIQGNIDQQFQDLGCDFSKMPESGITKELIESINPGAIILSNTDPLKIERPWDWLTRHWPVFYVHHSAVTPWLPGARADVFVSEHLKRRYNNLISRIHRPLVVPTGINPAPFVSIPRPRPSAPVRVGCLVSEESKFNRKLADRVVTIARNRFPYIMTDFAVIQPGHEAPSGYRNYGIDAREFFAGIDIFLYPSNVDETWGRTVAEAHAAGIPSIVSKRGGIGEIGKDGETYFLCSTEGQFVAALELLVGDVDKRNKMGAKARAHALTAWGVNPFKKHVEPLITAMALRG